MYHEHCHYFSRTCFVQLASVYLPYFASIWLTVIIVSICKIITVPLPWFICVPFISHLSLSVVCYFHCPWAISVGQINCQLCLLISLISFLYSVISFHHLYMMNHPTMFSLISLIYYQGLQLPISHIVYRSKSLSVSLSSLLFFSYVCGWRQCLKVTTQGN